MSKYEDYSEVSKVYDKERTAMGADTIAGLLHVYGGKPLKDLHVLDAGCGTGNYAKALIEFGVGKITLLDASKDMLAVAKEKLKTEIDNGIVDKVVEAKMPPLPFEDGSFDVVLFSLVLQHVDNTGTGDDYPIIEELFRRTKLVLRPEGLMVIVTALTSAKEVVWYTTIHQGVMKIAPSMKQFLCMLDENGFKCATKLSLLGCESIKDFYDGEGSLRKDWRKSLSLFGMASDEEIKEIESYVQGLKERGKLGEFLKRSGQTLDVAVLRPLFVILCEHKTDDRCGFDKETI